eukprot:TRINITY_DN9347_c0_g1_i1.p1 TRINITY_DN9347_c0_g1~~TRINITY_DN9347_c0_g1_i1.p1  ORF type:complete len:226 (+),score=48.90 TRINITY_DN9347_c0_g1_i1:34-678(+)
MEIKQTPIPPLSQRDQNDCGMTCLMMILKYRHIHTHYDDLLNTYLPDQHEHLWSIQIPFILRDLDPDLEVVYYTTSFGVSDGYHEDDQDVVQRIDALFFEAKAKGMPVIVRSLTNRYLIEHVLEGNVAIVLVNYSFLRLDLFDKIKASCFPVETFTEFVGHYLVICGYDPNTDEFLYRDPAVPDEEFLRVDSSILHNARTSPGTDEDLIFIFFE